MKLERLDHFGIEVADLRRAERFYSASAVAFKSVLLEGVEVFLIVVAAGSVTGSLTPASLGAAVAAVLVVMLGIAIHRPLTRIPENLLKFGVGVVVVLFGVFWRGQGLGFNWPGGELALPMIMASTLGLSWL